MAPQGQLTVQQRHTRCSSVCKPSPASPAWVQVPGALLSMGDAHTAQGNSELDGTGIETSITGDFRLTLHKAGSLPAPVQDLAFPLLENDNEYVVQGLQYAVCTSLCCGT